MSKQERTWEKPKLIILAKGTPEESVLTFCKTQNPTKQLEGPSVTRQDVCSQGNITNCAVCQNRAVGTGS